MTTGGAAGTPQLDLRGITKAFPGCLANDDISFQILPGEIHALLGENGAGKSTLVKIIYGVLAADSGEIRWQGQPARISSPKEARRLGIGMVFQHFSLFEALTVTENIALALDTPFKPRALEARIEELSDNYGLPLHPHRAVHSLSVGERQRIEIVRCLLQDPKLLIMDEPTSVLTPQEVDRLFETLHRLAAEGCAILYISHKLEELRALCHKATILRHGRVVGSCDPQVESAARMAQMMVGEAITLPQRRDAILTGAPRLSVTIDHLPAEDQLGVDLKDIRLSVRAGEVFGIAGVAGNGQAELMAALLGEVLCDDPDSVTIMGQPAGQLGPRRRRALGAAFVPEERLGEGAVPDLDLTENAYLSGYGRPDMTRRGFVRTGARNSYAQKVVSRFDVRTRGIESDARSLSGGNLQKFIVGREIQQHPDLLIIAQPTWGVDAGAAAAIHQAILDLASGHGTESGAAVLIISQDLDEVLTLCDRFAVMSEGRLSEPLDPREVSREEVGLLMGGVQGVDDSELTDSNAAA